MIPVVVFWSFNGWGVSEWRGIIGRSQADENDRMGEEERRA